MEGNSQSSSCSRRNALGQIAIASASGVLLAFPGAASACNAAAAAAIAPVQDSTAITPDLAALAAAHFEPLLGDTFAIGGDKVTLSEVRRGIESGAGYREQFALTFTAAPAYLPLASDLVPVSHPTIGRHELLVTRVNDAGGRTLEICFS
jgi:hypothetical protein